MDYFSIALITGALVGVLSGLVGTLVVLRERAFFTVALTHATFPGGVVAAILGVNVVFGAAAMGLLLVALMTLLSSLRRQGRQVAAGIVLSLGYALGMFLFSLHPNLPVKVDSFLTGSILAISPFNIAVITGVLALVIVTYAAVGKELLYSTFDRRGFVASGYREGAIDAIVLTLIALTVVAAMPAIGSILAIAMIAAPAAAARLLTRHIGRMLALSSAFGVAAAVLGLWASRWFSLAAGGSMALAATAIFVVAVVWSGARKRWAGGRGAQARAAETSASGGPVSALRSLERREAR